MSVVEKNGSVLLGVGDCGATGESGKRIRTLALGSCVGLVAFDRLTGAVGMVHIALPESGISPEKAAVRPGYFADTGVAALLRAMLRAGAGANSKNYVFKMAGGAKVMDPNSTFDIGKRNVIAIRKILWAQGLGVIAEDVGSNISRTVTITVGSIALTITSSGRGEWSI